MRSTGNVVGLILTFVMIAMLLVASLLVGVIARGAGETRTIVVTASAPVSAAASRSVRADGTAPTPTPDYAPLAAFLAGFGPSNAPTAAPQAVMVTNAPVPTSVPATTSSIIPTATPIPASQTATPAPRATGLRPQEVQAWCGGAPNCIAARFMQLPESNGAINPNGVKYLSGDATTFQVPAGVTVDVWDCFHDSHFTGPGTLTQVCAASFRRAA